MDPSVDPAPDGGDVDAAAAAAHTVSADVDADAATAAALCAARDVDAAAAEVLVDTPSLSEMSLLRDFGPTTKTVKVLPDPKRRAERKATCATGEKVTYKPTTVVNCKNIVAALSTPERQKPAKTVFKKSISDDLEKITKDVPRAGTP